MDRLGGREIKHLLGQNMEKTSVPLRMSKITSKRHPDKIHNEQRQMGKLACWGVGPTGGLRVQSDIGLSARCRQRGTATEAGLKGHHNIID